LALINGNEKYIPRRCRFSVVACKFISMELMGQSRTHPGGKCNGLWCPVVSQMEKKFMSSTEKAFPQKYGRILCFMLFTYLATIIITEKRHSKRRRKTKYK
jgi:hypothetical protein